MLNKLSLNSVSFHKSAAVCIILSRHCSQNMKVIKNVDTANLKRGTGGRSSFSGNVVTVFGATGFFGKNICNELGKRGAQIIVPFRCDADDYNLKRLKLMGDLGQVLFQPFNLKDITSIKKAVKYSNVVINLIGANYETRNFKFYDIHEKGARDIAAACAEFNVERLIHFSALNVTQTPKRYYLIKNDFLPSKLRGEQAVFEEFPCATIFRPGACYGYFDKFLWPLCMRERATSQSIPLYASGRNTIKQPVFVRDLALGVVNAIEDYQSRGKIYQAVGPERYYLRDIAIYCAQVLQRDKPPASLVHDIKFDIKFPIVTFISRYILGIAMVAPVRGMSFEQIEWESITDEVDPNLPTLIDLNVPLRKLENVVWSLIYERFNAEPNRFKDVDRIKQPDSLSEKALSPYSFNN